MSQNVSIFYYHNYPEESVQPLQEQRQGQARDPDLDAEATEEKEPNASGSAKPGASPPQRPRRGCVDRAYACVIHHWLLIPVIVALLTLIMGLWGFLSLDGSPASGGPPGFWEKLGQAFWKTCGLPLGETLTADKLEPPMRDLPWQLIAARCFGVLFAFSALVVIAWRALTPTFIRLRVSLLKRRGNFDVICGLGWKAFELARNLRSFDCGRCLLIIDSDPENPFRGEFCEDFGVVIITGDATRRHVLKSAGIEAADNIYVIGDSDEMNSRIVGQIATVCGNRDASDEPGVPCFVDIRDILIRAHLENSTRDNRADVMCFDLLEMTVRRLLMANPPAPVDGRPVHLVVFGDTPAGRALVLEQLRSLHLPRSQQARITWYMEGDVNNPGLFEAKKRAFYQRFPCLDPDWTGPDDWSKEDRDDFAVLMRDVFPYATDDEPHATDGEPQANLRCPVIEIRELPHSESAIRSRGLAPYASLKAGWDLQLYVCIDNGIRSAAVSNLLNKCLQEWAETLTENGVFEVGDPEPFGEYSEECMPENIRGVWLEEIGQRVRLFYSIKDASYDPAEHTALVESIRHSPRGLNGLLNERWRAATEWDRDSNRQSAAHAVVKLRSLGIKTRLEKIHPGPAQDGDGRSTFRLRLGAGEKSLFHKKIGLGEPKMLAEDIDFAYYEPPAEKLDTLDELADMEHRRWCAERLLNGWLPLPHALLETWETDKQAKKRFKDPWHLHRDLVPFDDVPEGDRDYDYYITANTTELFPEAD